MATSDSTPDAITIQLNKGYTTTIDVIDGDLAQLGWRVHIYDNGERFYVERSVAANGRSFNAKLHRVILARVLGRELLFSEKVDHWDRDGLNNKRENLRLASNAENCRNSRRHKNNTSGYKGVHWEASKRKWRATISVNNKRIHLGYFSTSELGYEAYCKAAVKYYGEFARFE